MVLTGVGDAEGKTNNVIPEEFCGPLGRSRQQDDGPRELLWIPSPTPVSEQCDFIEASRLQIFQSPIDISSYPSLNYTSYLLN